MNPLAAGSRARGLPLFSHLGAPIADPAIRRILSWDEWTGPEDPLAYAIGERQQSMHDAIIAPDEEEAWKRCLDDVVRHVARLIPYDERQDTWHAPTSAAWHAGWTFALEAAYVEKAMELPAELRAQIHWFELGHWPCSLRSATSMADIDGYVVF